MSDTLLRITRTWKIPGRGWNPNPPTVNIINAVIDFYPSVSSTQYVFPAEIHLVMRPPQPIYEYLQRVCVRVCGVHKKNEMTTVWHFWCCFTLWYFYGFQDLVTYLLRHYKMCFVFYFKNIYVIPGNSTYFEITTQHKSYGYTTKVSYVQIGRASCRERV